MPPVRRTWQLRPHDDQAVQHLARRADVSPVLAQLLLNRGVNQAAEATRFLDAPMSGLHPPHLLPGVPAAAERIARAVADRVPICVYGDYDVDGTTGTAILYTLLTRLGADVRYYVPNRVEEGYGVNEAAVRQLAEDGVKLLVTVDCGICSVAEAEVARECGMAMIVTDHHEMRAELPNAAVLVHPRLPGSEYPFAGLSGSCVAFKLAWAVAQRATNSERVPDEYKAFLQDAMGLAALGLIADVMPLRDENRIFVRHGLRRLVAKPSVGIRALLIASGLMKTDEDGRTTTTLKAEDVGFRIGPRINAAGRLGCARLVVELLTTNSPVKAREAAEFLEDQNAKRQTIERNLTAAAKQMVEDLGYADAPAIVLGQVEWHPGVVGIVAGRLAEHFGRPVLVAALKENDELSGGSGRSVAGFELHKALMQCDAVLEGHGGHAAAAGFKVRPSKLDELRELFCAAAREVFPGGPPPPVLKLDAEVPLASLNFALMKDLDKLEPYGMENSKPRFLASGLKIEGTPRRIGQGERHLSFRVTQGGTKIRAVAWGMGDRLDDLMAAGGDCCLVFTPKINEWNGYKSVEIEVTDFQASAVPELG